MDLGAAILNTADQLTEAQFQRQVESLAGNYGWVFYHTHDSRRSQSGFPDLVLIRERLIFAELKTAKGMLAPEQHAWRWLLGRLGSEYYLWRPSDLDQVNRTLHFLKPGEAGLIPTEIVALFDQHLPMKFKKELMRKFSA